MKTVFQFAAAVAILCCGCNIYAVEFRRAASFEDAHAASCRVCVSGARGTGWFAGVDGDTAYVITNHHVVTSNTAARLDFWTNGRMESVNGSVCLRAYNAEMPADFACIAVRASELKKIDPPFIALGGADARPSVGAFIVSAGAPDGRFVQAWRGQVLEYYNGKTAVFSPPPVPGQSGSAICEFVDGQLFATGILTWLLGTKGADDSKGGAIPIANLYRAISSRGVDVDYETTSPIPPDATECAADADFNAPCVLFFTQDDCPPCEEAKKDVAALRSSAVPVYTVDIRPDETCEIAATYGVDRTPTFIVVDSSREIAGKFVGIGAKEDVYNTYKEVVGRSKQTKTTSETPGFQPPAVENHPQISVELPQIQLEIPLASPKSGASSGVTPPAKSVMQSPSTANADAPDYPAPRFSSSASVHDFRLRPNVYDFNANVGFFEDSNDRWNNRRGGNKSERILPENEDEPKEVKPRAGERIAGNVVDAIAAKAEKLIDKKADEMKESLIRKWKRVRFTLLMTFLSLVVIALFLAESLSVVVRKLWQKAVVFFSDDEVPVSAPKTPKTPTSKRTRK